MEATTCGIIGLAIISSAYIAEIYRGSLKAIHQGQHEAAHALGVSPFHHFRYITAPQLFRISLPALTAFVIGLLKDSSIASAIGVPEVAFTAKTITRQSFSGLTVYLLAGLVYIVLSILLAWISRSFYQSLRQKVTR